MTGESNLDKLLKTMTPKLNAGAYVFCSILDLQVIDNKDVIMIFKEEEGYTVILKQEMADNLKFDYSFVAAWITLTVHSSLQAVGLTAAFSKALTDGNISCNVVAGYFHDHIFVSLEDAERAMNILNSFAPAQNN
jgi:hypothetical protein